MRLSSVVIGLFYLFSANSAGEEDYKVSEGFIKFKFNLGWRRTQKLKNSLSLSSSLKSKLNRRFTEKCSLLG